MNNYRLNKVLDIFNEHRPKIVLDIGCGDGGFSVKLQKTSSSYILVGVDSNRDAIVSNPYHITSYLIDMNYGTIPCKGFDGIFCGEVIEHLVETDHLLDEIHRVMSDDGFCVLTTPNLGSWYNRIALLLGYQPFWTEVSSKHNTGKLCTIGGSTTAGHLRLFTLKALKELVELHGFDIEHVYGVSDAHIPKPLNTLDKAFALSPSMSSNIIIVMRKKMI